MSSNSKQKCLDCCSLLVRKKNLREAASLATPLDRCLNIWHLIFYGIAHMAGAGIYVLVGTIVKDKSGPAAVFSFLACGITSIFTGLCYVEFATLIPRTGSCYTFTYITLGELPAFVVGWTMLSDIIIILAAVAKAFSSTLNVITNQAITNYTIEHVGRFPSTSVLGETWDFVAFGLIIILMLVTITGAHISMTFNIGLSVLQLTCLTLVTICCFVYGSSENWTDNKGGFFPYGFGGVIFGASVAVFAYCGFEVIANAAEESQQPRRDLPIALLTSLGIIMVLYCMASLGISYLVNYQDIDPGSPFAAGFAAKHQRWMEIIAAIGTLLATGANKLATMYILPRILYAIASDGLIFSVFAFVDKRTKVPLVGLFFGGSLSAILALFLNIESLAEFVSMGILLSFFFIGVDLLFLRYLYFEEENRKEEYSDFNLDNSENTKVEETETLTDKTSNRIRKCSLAAKIIARFPNMDSLIAVKIVISLFIVFSLLNGIVIQYLLKFMQWWSWLVFGLDFMVVVVLFLILLIYKPHRIKEMYESPLNPLSPCVTILVNGVMLAGIQPMTWLRCAIWTTFGLLIYIFYGIRHSKQHGDTLSNGYINLDDRKVSQSDTDKTFAPET